MPYVDPEFDVPTVPEDEKYEGTEVDQNVFNGTRLSRGDLNTASEQAESLTF